MVVRFLKHAFSGGCVRLLSKPQIALINDALKRAEIVSSAEIKLIIENGIRPNRFSIPASKDRARELFSSYRVWDTERNNGLLIYIELVDHAIEIVFDRGIKLSESDLTTAMEYIREGFLNNYPGEGISKAIDSLAKKLAVDFPPTCTDINEVTDKIEFL